MRVSHVEVIEPWKAAHAGISFVPKLLPSLHADKQTCQADNGLLLLLVRCVSGLSSLGHQCEVSTACVRSQQAITTLQFVQIYF